MSEPMCLKFSKMYKGKPRKQSCFGNLDVGREYVCPDMGPAEDPYKNHPMNTWFNEQYQKSQIACHGTSPQIGYNVLCTKTCNRSQTGGSRKSQRGSGTCNLPSNVPKGMRLQYSATGDLVESSCACEGFTSRQRGGDAGEFMGDNAEHGYPRNSCSTNPSSKCAYVKYNTCRQYGNHQREVPGWTFDLKEPSVGNRPVQTEHDNSCNSAMIPRDGEAVTNYKGKKFNCTQPFWFRPCQ